MRGGCGRTTRLSHMIAKHSFAPTPPWSTSSYSCWDQAFRTTNGSFNHGFWSRMAFVNALTPTNPPRQLVYVVDVKADKMNLTACSSSGPKQTILTPGLAAHSQRHNTGVARTTDAEYKAHRKHWGCGGTRRCPCRLQGDSLSWPRGPLRRRTSPRGSGIGYRGSWYGRRRGCMSRPTWSEVNTPALSMERERRTMRVWGTLVRT